jgi:hypothetical protein
MCPVCQKLRNVVGAALSSLARTRDRMMFPMSSTTEQIVYEQADRLITQQARTLDELRMRTAIVLTASTLTAGFLGDAALSASTDARDDPQS